MEAATKIMVALSSEYPREDIDLHLVREIVIENTRLTVENAQLKKYFFVLMNEKLVMPIMSFEDWCEDIEADLMANVKLRGSPLLGCPSRMLGWAAPR